MGETPGLPKEMVFLRTLATAATLRSLKPLSAVLGALALTALLGACSFAKTEPASESVSEVVYGTDESSVIGNVYYYESPIFSREK